MAVSLQVIPADKLSPLAEAMHVGTWRMRFIAERRPVTADTVSAAGLTLSKARVCPSVSQNIPTARFVDYKYVIYWSDRPHGLSLPGRAPSHLRPGEIVVLDTRTSFEVSFPRSCTAWSLIVDGTLFEKGISGAAQFANRSLARYPELSAAVRSIVEAGLAYGCRDAFPDISVGLAAAFFNLMSVVRFAGAGKSETERSRIDLRGDQVRHFIKRHCVEPELSVAAVAQALRISTRYVGKALAGSAISPTQYIKACRLERAADLLNDPASQPLNITEIAFACGFNSSSHFSNAFRSYFGMSARAFRMHRHNEPGCLTA